MGLLKIGLPIFYKYKNNHMNKEKSISHSDLLNLKQLQIIEKKLANSMNEIFVKVEPISILIGRMNEAKADFNTISLHITELNKRFNDLNKEFRKRKRQLEIFENKKRVFLDELYKKYDFRLVENALKTFKK